MLKSGTSVQIIDTRPKHYTTKAQDIMEGAVWRDPERLDDWIGTLSKTEPVVTFCVYGFHTDARRLQRCVRPGSMPGICPAGILPGRQSRVRCGFLNDPVACRFAFHCDVRTPEFSILQELGRMPDPQRRSAIVAAMLFLLGVTDMSNRAISFEAARSALRLKAGRPPLQGRAIPNGRSKAMRPAPSKSKVVKQSGRATYPLLLKTTAASRTVLLR